ncbi:hypothetical protein [Rhabdothermincola sediminis]|uniref:hypothetical protein n=1 Tax=Rhabdothermincola sediminis TaxID=2751370 RepID=UPI001AA00E93|nr:hypothetical protein [Rhabdothermincola sediminis]
MGHDALRLFRDTVYVTVGFGVIAFQKLQVRRRELEKSLEQQLDGPRRLMDGLLGREDRA